jgi:uncharacterized protein
VVTHDMRDAYRDAPEPARAGASPALHDRDRDEEGRPANARPRDRCGRPLPRGARDEMAHAEDPEAVTSSLEEAFARAVELFDEERFFEAHEFFEHVWKSDWVDPDDKEFWKGVTQVAVGCCHVQRGNGRGALTLLERAADYLAAYPDRYHGVDTVALAEAARAVAAQVRTEGASPRRAFPGFPRAD